jgi:hypothetical protein
MFIESVLVVELVVAHVWRHFVLDISLERHVIRFWVISFCDISSTFVVTFHANTEAAIILSISPAVGTKAADSIKADLAKANLVV